MVPDGASGDWSGAAELGFSVRKETGPREQERVGCSL
jgi:hypothetical protein